MYFMSDGQAVLPARFSYQNPECVSIDKEAGANDDAMHLAGFGEINHLPYPSLHAGP